MKTVTFCLLWLLGSLAGAAGPPARSGTDSLKNWRQEYKQVRKAWRQARTATDYKQVLNALMNLRPHTPHTWQLEYMIGVAACNGRDGVCNPLYYLRNSCNHAPNDYKAFIAKAYEQCSNPQVTLDAVLLTSVPLDQVYGQPGSLAVYKMGNVEDVKSNGTIALGVSDSVSEDMYEARLFARPDSLELGTLMKSVSIFARTSVYYLPHFVLSADSSLRPGDVKKNGAELEQAYAFFRRTYGFQEPDYLIAAYYLNTQSWNNTYTGQGGFPEYVSALGRKKDHIIIPPNIIGYNNPNDLSIVGFATGTLFHELMHLLLYRDFADAPAWFAEGLPALYEVAASGDDGRLTGLPSWRYRFLVADRKIAATPLDTLFTLDNASFNVPTYANAVHVATARYLCLYLQERKSLTAVYKTLQALPVSQLVDPAATRKAIETAVGLPMPALQKDFTAFLYQTINRTNPGVLSP